MYILVISSPLIWVKVNTGADHNTLFCSFVYADNYYIDRRVLWSNLVGHAGLMRNRPWVLLGNFNAALNLKDHSAGGYESNVAMREFKDHTVSRIIRLVFFVSQRRMRHVSCCKEVKGAEISFPNKIEISASNNLYDGNQVLGAFVHHYNQFIRPKAEGVTITLDDHDLFTHVFDNAKANFMVRDVSNYEVKIVIFSMGDDRAPSPNGFTTTFFKKAWDVVGGDIICVVRDFFSNGKLLKELNHTIISFIPKVTTPARINDYRPISCCNVLYKCISKIIANRVKECLGDIVSINQYAFVHGRKISNNILLTQELMRNYHRRRGPPRCAFKVDIQKAYDTVDWSFLETILMGFGFHPKMVQWIMVCVSGASYFICVNGNLHGWFKGKRGEMKKGKAKVAWDSVCMPKHEGALGIRRIDDFIVALMATHIRSILTHRESLWVKWVHTYKLKGRSFWDVPYRGDADVCPLKDMFSNRDIGREDFSLDDSVNNLISDGLWQWPLDWLSRFLIMAQLQPFSMACAWDTIRTRANIVNWYNVVWFPHCILWHAIHMWLVFQQKLKTQDRLQQWDVSPSIDLNLLRCPLCDLVPDFHDHLFFECAFSSHVWSKFRVLCGMDSIPSRLIDVTTFITPISKGKTAVSILFRLVLDATSYYIWLERNGRLFKKKTMSSDQIVDVIISMVQLKLVTFKFKKMSARSRMLLD
nr:hypothetical protein [Tanacetum cinerariifolium]